MTTASLPTIADLWREVRAWLAAALSDFRGPAAIAATLARSARAAIRARLALIESLMMKLLLIEASELQPVSHPFPGRRAAASPGPINTLARERGAAKAAHRLHAVVFMGPGLGAPRQSGNGWSEDPSRPETWRVRFRLRVPPQARASSASTRLQLQPRAESIRAQAHARRLARRFEALRRVIADPRHAIANLARRLASLGRTIARRIALARPSHSTSLGPIFASAMVLSQDASFSFPHDTR